MNCKPTMRERFFDWQDDRRHGKHLDECDYCKENLEVVDALYKSTMHLRNLFGSKPFLITTNELLQFLNVEVCPACIGEQIQELNGGAK